MDEILLENFTPSFKKKAQKTAGAKSLPYIAESVNTFA